MPTPVKFIYNGHKSSCSIAKCCLMDTTKGNTYEGIIASSGEPLGETGIRVPAGRTYIFFRDDKGDHVDVLLEDVDITYV